MHRPFVVQTSMRESSERFDNFLQRRMDANWASMRHGLLSASAGSSLSAQSSAVLPDARVAAVGLLPAPSAAPFSPIYPSPSGKATFTPAQQELTKAVRNYLCSSQAGTTFHALDELQRVLKDLTPDGTQPSSRASEVLQILRSQTECMSSSTSSRGGGTARAQLAALEGSLKYLETAYLKLMEQRVRADRQMAMAGGTGSVASLIQGFVTSSSRAAGGKSFVPLGRQALAWQQVRLGIEVCCCAHTGPDSSMCAKQDVLTLLQKPRCAVFSNGDT